MRTEAADLPRIAYRPSEVSQRTGIPRPSVYRLIDDGVIPKIAGLGDRVLVPAWALEAWAATGDWRHPDWRPVPPGVDLDTTADVIPLHPDAP